MSYVIVNKTEPGNLRYWGGGNPETGEWVGNLRQAATYRYRQYHHILALRARHGGLIEDEKLPAIPPLPMDLEAAGRWQRSHII